MWWHAVTHGKGKWRGNWQMEWIASTLHITSEHGVSSITTADAHTSAASSRLNWRPRRFKWTRPFRRKTKSGFCACAITFQTQSTCITNMSKHYMQTSVPQSTWLAVRDLLTFNDCVYNKHTQMVFVFSKAPTLPLSPTHPPSQWVHEALSSARKRPGSEPILVLPHPPSWCSHGLLYLYYEMIPDYLSRRIKTRHCQIWSHIIIIISRQQQDNVICLVSVSVDWSFFCLMSCYFFV